MSLAGIKRLRQLVRWSHKAVRSIPETGAAKLWLPQSMLAGTLTVEDGDRSRGLFVRAGSGSGKSILLGRFVCFQDLLRGTPQVIIDPMGALAENLFLQIALLPLEERMRIWPRLVYVDMGGGERVVPFPLLAHNPGESFTDVADRFLEALRKIDPHLQGASVQGWNAVVTVGRPILMVLAALGKPIDAAHQLLRSPKGWLDELTGLVARYPEVEAAVEYIRNEYAPLSTSERLALSRSLRVKLAPFSLDPALSGIFSTTGPGIDLSEIAAGRKTVILDMRNELNVDRRRFKTRWIYEWFLAYVRQRPPGEPRPFGFVIDELTELTNQVSLGQDLFARDIDTLVNFHGRNRNLALSFATQELFALSKETQKTLLTMGTQVQGLTADMESAKLLAEQFFALDPYRVKRTENVWGSDGMGSAVVEERDAFMSLEEQVLLAAQQLLALPPFEFFVKKRNDRRLHKVSIRSQVEGAWTSDFPGALAHIRDQLGRRVAIDRHVDTPPPTVLPTEPAAPDTIEGPIPHETTQDTGNQLDSDDWDTADSAGQGLSPPIS